MSWKTKAKVVTETSNQKEKLLLKPQIMTEIIKIFVKIRIMLGWSTWNFCLIGAGELYEALSKFAK